MVKSHRKVPCQLEILFSFKEMVHLNNIMRLCLTYFFQKKLRLLRKHTL